MVQYWHRFNPFHPLAFESSIFTTIEVEESALVMEEVNACRLHAFQLRTQDVSSGIFQQTAEQLKKLKSQSKHDLENKLSFPLVAGHVFVSILFLLQSNEWINACLLTINVNSNLDIHVYIIEKVTWIMNWNVATILMTFHPKKVVAFQKSKQLCWWIFAKCPCPTFPNCARVTQICSRVAQSCARVALWISVRLCLTPQK